MLLNSFIFAVSSSIDSLGIGITYGIKNMKISFFSKFILFIISISITYFALFLGNLLSNVLSDFFTIIIGSGILIFMGAYFIYEALRTKRNDFNIFNNPISSFSCVSSSVVSCNDFFIFSPSSGFTNFIKYVLANPINTAIIDVIINTKNVAPTIFPSLFGDFIFDIDVVIVKNINGVITTSNKFKNMSPKGL